MSAVRVFLLHLAWSSVLIHSAYSNITEAQSFGFQFVKHSQTATVPQCPQDLTKLWDGYSFLFMEGTETTDNRIEHSSNVLAGSCLPLFSTSPLMECDADKQCRYAAANNNVKAYWLSTDDRLPSTEVSETNIEKYISRCVVCEAPANVIAVHSQTIQTPDCPTGWSALWMGFSFAMHAGAGGGLSSPDSCLEEFRTAPFVECSEISCSHSVYKSNFWLANIDKKQQTENQITASDAPAHVSRCQVCIKDKSSGTLELEAAKEAYEAAKRSNEAAQKSYEAAKQSLEAAKQLTAEAKQPNEAAKKSNKTASNTNEAVLHRGLLAYFMLFIVFAFSLH